ncbi:MAG: endolytic transglycosylase MltG [Eggerthellaceae bacterium]|nr:endolytic transglycosylase MltG [Eggerthellaceae bacterium]
MYQPHDRYTYAPRNSRMAQSRRGRARMSDAPYGQPGSNMRYGYDTVAARKLSMPVIIAIVAISAVVVVGLVVGISALLNNPSNQEAIEVGKEVVITIDEGESASQIGQKLVKAGFMTMPQFSQALNAADAATKLKPGTYVFVGGMTPDEIIRIMVEGMKKEQLVLMIPEGSKLETVAAIVSNVTNGRISAQAFIDACGNASVYASRFSWLRSAGSNSLEGFLYPETYFIDEDSTADDIIRKLLDQFERTMFTAQLLDTNVVGYDSTGYTYYDLIKLASIVEKEVANDTDRGKVASVFWNRLSTRGWKLESCATVVYYLGHQPTDAEARTMPAGYEEYRPYNTYINAGLPPTPICSPSVSSIRAVLHPDKGNYFYFCSGGEDGNRTTLFAETLDQHTANQRTLGIL